MRMLALTSAALVALAVGSYPAVSQQQREDGGTGAVKGQSERPTSPKQAEPESSSHNADTPKETGAPSTSSDDRKQPAPGQTPPDKKKK